MSYVKLTFSIAKEFNHTVIDDNMSDHGSFIKLYCTQEKYILIDHFEPTYY